MKPWNKLLFLSIFTFFFHVSLSAQYHLGGGLDYNVDVKRAGLFVRGTTTIDSLWRGAATFNLFLENGSKATRFEVSADAHYFFWENYRYRSYLIGGINLYHQHFATRGRDTGPPPPVRNNEFGINLGGGIETPLNDRLLAFGEAKVSVGDGSLFGIHIGLLYRLKE